MKSITKCPHCETQFYVDDEQLSQYNGKVRCGNCLEVFVAADYFIDKQESKPTPVVTAPTAEVVEEINTDNLPVDVESVEEKLQVDQPLPEASIPDPAASFEFKQSDAEGSEEETNQSDPIEDELDGLTSVRDVDENFIAKTESLIKNIDIEDAAAKLEPETKSTSIKSTGTEGSSDDKADIKKPARRKSFLDDDPEEVVIQQPGFSFKIDSPDTLDVLSKWREDAAKTPETTDSVAPDVEVKEEKLDADRASITEPPTPMTDEFVLPEPGQTVQDTQAKTDDPSSENYDFLLTEKEPLSPWMIALAVLLVLLLLGQGIYYFRNQIARSVPELKPLLQQFCAPIGCKVSLPKEINLLSIDDSGIQQDAKLQGVIRLSSTITNRAKFSQAYPKLEVTLTDERDMPKVRRVFAPTDYLKKQVNLADGIQAGESIPVEMALMTDAESISGFRILLAY